MPTAADYQKYAERWRKRVIPKKEPKKIVFYEDREEAYYRPKVPKIKNVPVPEIVERQLNLVDQPYYSGNVAREQRRLDFGYPEVRKPATPRKPYEAFAPIEQPLRWVNPTPGTYSGGLPTAPYITDIYSSWLNITPESIFRDMGIGGRKEQRAGGGFSIDWRGMYENYKRIFKKYYEGPMFDFAITGQTEPLYNPQEDYTYGYGDGGGEVTYTIRYGGSGTPSSNRKYSANLVNWRV